MTQATVAFDKAEAMSNQVNLNTAEIEATKTRLASTDAVVESNTKSIHEIEFTVNVLDNQAVKYNADKTTVTLQSNDNKGTVIENVAAGEVSATSTQAVNGAQLHATEQKVEKIVEEQLVPVQADVATVKTEVATVKSTVTKNSQRLDTHEQVIVAQQNQIREINEVNNVQNTYIVRNAQSIERNRQAIENNSRRIDNLEKQSKKDRREARAGAAATIAMTQITPVQGKRLTIGAGAGTYRGESAVAVGVKYAPTKNVVLSLTGSADTRGGFGAGTGVSVGFD